MVKNLELLGYGYFISDTLSEKSTARFSNCYEIELYTTSNGTSFIDNKQLPHSKGNILIIKPDQQRQSIGLFECHFVHFYCLDEHFSKKYLDVLPQLIKNCDTIKFSILFNAITDAATNKQNGYELYVTAKLIELIAELYTISENYKAKDSRFSIYTFNIYEATTFMQNNLSSHITLADIAKIANLSPSYFHTAFKNIVGTTPHRYLLNIRLKTAQKFLLNSKKTLAEIAEECGFESQVYLNYIFKKELSITPKHYRDTEKVIII